MWEVSGADNRSGPPMITSEVTPRSHNTDLEYCLQSEEWHPVRKNPTTCLSIRLGAALYHAPSSHPPPCLRGPYLWHTVPLLQKPEISLVLTSNINHDPIRLFTALSKRRQTRQQKKYDSIWIIYTVMYMIFYSKKHSENIIWMSASFVTLW